MLTEVEEELHYNFAARVFFVFMISGFLRLFIFKNIRSHSAGDNARAPAKNTRRAI